PLYRPGETVRFRSLVLERFGLEPAREKLAVRYTLTTPTGAVLDVPPVEALAQADDPPDRWAATFDASNKTLHGLGAGEWVVPANSPEGDYVLAVSEADNRFPAQQRQFGARRYHQARLSKELVFTRSGYGPGEEVVALARATRLGGGPVANRPVTATVELDGKTIGADGQPAALPLRL